MLIAAFCFILVHPFSFWNVGISSADQPFALAAYAYQNSPNATNSSKLTDEAVIQGWLKKRISIDAGGIPLVEVVKTLRTSYGFPISFIDPEVDDGMPHSLSLRVDNLPLAEVLNQIVSELPNYRWEAIKRNIVLFPDKPKYNAVVHQTGIKDIGRLEAVRMYIAQLQTQQPEFSDLLTPLVKGYAAAPLYTESVTLESDAKVIQHFVELMGDNKTVFSIIKAKSGQPMFLLETVP